MTFALWDEEGSRRSGRQQTDLGGTDPGLSSLASWLGLGKPGRLPALTSALLGSPGTLYSGPPLGCFWA